MGYRKIKKAFVRKFGWTINVKVLDKDEKPIKKYTKKATAIYMKHLLYEK